MNVLFLVCFFIAQGEYPRPAFIDQLAPLFEKGDLDAASKLVSGATRKHLPALDYYSMVFVMPDTPADLRKEVLARARFLANALEKALGTRGAHSVVDGLKAADRARRYRFHRRFLQLARRHPDESEELARARLDELHELSEAAQSERWPLLELLCLLRSRELHDRLAPHADEALSALQRAAYLLGLLGNHSDEHSMYGRVYNSLLKRRQFDRLSSMTEEYATILEGRREFLVAHEAIVRLVRNLMEHREHKRARSALGRAAQLSKHLDATDGEAAQTMIVMHHCDGMLRWHERAYQQAKEPWRRALLLVPRLPANQASWRCQFLMRLAQIERILSNYASSVDLCKQALTALQKAPNRQIECRLRLALANSLNGLHLGDDAGREFEIVVEIGRALKDHEAVGVALIGLSKVYLQRGQFERARDALVEGLETQPKLRSPVTEAYLATCLAGLGREHESKEAFLRAQGMARQVGSDSKRAKAIMTLALLLEPSDPRHLELLTEAYELSKKVPGWNARELLRNLASGHADRGNDRRALHYFDALANCSPPARSLSEHYSQSRSEIEWLWAGGRISECALRLQDEDPNVLASALRTLERLRAQSLLAGLQEVSTDSAVTFDVELKTKRDELRRRIEKERLVLLGEADKPSRSQRDASEAIQKMLEQYRSLEVRLRRSSPQLQKLVRPTPTSLPELQASVLKPDEALIVYVVSGLPARDSVFAWVITKRSAILRRLCSRAALLDTYNQFMKGIVNRSNGYLEPAHQLYRYLIDPIAEDIKPCTKLAVVPDAFLALLPLDALLTRAPIPNSTADDPQPYLLHEFSVNYVASASTLAWLRAQDREDPSSRKILLMGDARYEANVKAPPSPTNQRLTTNRMRLARLRKTRREVLSIARIHLSKQDAKLIKNERDVALSFDSVDVYLGNEVRASRFQQVAPSCAEIHLALHGHIDYEHPWFSGLLFSHSPDDFLSVMDIGAMQLRADLVFLSACSTAGGKLLHSEGIQSVARAFLISGARSVIATMWDIQDEAVPPLALEFYRMRAKKHSVRDALRLAKIALKRKQRSEVPEQARGDIAKDKPRKQTTTYAHPYHWAAFVIWGG